MDINTLNNLEAFLLSERVTLKGSEVMAFNMIIAAVQSDKNSIMAVQRVQGMPRPLRPVPDPKAAAPAEGIVPTGSE